MKCVGEVFRKLFEYRDIYAPREVTLLNQPLGDGIVAVAKGIHGPLRLRNFCLHSMPDLSHKQQIELLYDIFQGLPLPFQFLHCTNKTTQEEISLFLQRSATYPQHKFIMIDVDLLVGDVQEVSNLEIRSHIPVNFLIVFFCRCSLKSVQIC